MLILYGVIIMVISIAGGLFSLLGDPAGGYHATMCLIIGLSIAFTFFSVHKYLKDKEK